MKIWVVVPVSLMLTLVSWSISIFVDDLVFDPSGCDSNKEYGILGFPLKWADSVKLDEGFSMSRLVVIFPSSAFTVPLFV